MVKIIKGTYLCKDKKGFRRSITAKDGPQTFDKEEEARLVSLGVAEYVTGSTEPVKVEPKAEKVIVKEERPPVVAKPAKAKAKAKPKTTQKEKAKPEKAAEEEEAPPEFTASELV